MKDIFKILAIVIPTVGGCVTTTWIVSNTISNVDERVSRVETKLENTATKLDLVETELRLLSAINESNEK